MKTSVLDLLAFMKKLPKLPIDPLQLWPIDEKVSKKLYKGKLETCDLLLHNLRNIEIRELAIHRNENLTDLNFFVRAHLPSVFITGTYALSELRYLGIMRERNKMGRFEIDLSYLDAEFRMRMYLDENQKVHAEKASLEFEWQDTTLNFENFLRDEQSTRSKLTHLLINQLGVGDLVVQKQREMIQSLVDPWVKETLRCAVEQPFDDLDLCMEDLWKSLGFEYPFEFPECTIKKENY